jgi:heme-degrading monooxygenase HmoA
LENKQMITRIWHGWTTPENADAYEELLRSNLFPKIADRRLEGYEGAHLLRRDSNEGVEFITLLWFETFEAVKAFAREASTLAEARQLLVASDPLPQHYRVIPQHEQ